MQDELSPKNKDYRDEWGTGTREGYEDRGRFRPPNPAQKPRGSPLLRMLGGVSIVSGIFWGVYLVTRGGGVISTLQQNHGPIAIVALGVICSLLGKYLRL